MTADTPEQLESPTVLPINLVEKPLVTREEMRMLASLLNRPNQGGELEARGLLPAEGELFAEIEFVHRIEPTKPQSRPFGGAGLEIETGKQTAHFTSGEKVVFDEDGVKVYNRDGTRARELSREIKYSDPPHITIQLDNGATLYMYAGRAEVEFKNGARVGANDGRVTELYAPPYDCDHSPQTKTIIEVPPPVYVKPTRRDLDGPLMRPHDYGPEMRRITEGIPKIEIDPRWLWDGLTSAERVADEDVKGAKNLGRLSFDLKQVNF